MKLLKIDVSPKRIYGLDILRALAILFVVIGHGKLVLPKSFAPIHNYIVFDGVSIFFVLSGFLIGGILIKTFEGRKATGGTLFHFWIRRWFRTLPNYFFILLVLLWLTHLDYPSYNFAKVKEYFYFSQNLWTRHPPFFGEAWSLSIEEWFYLLIPIVMFALIRLLRLSTKKAVLFTALFVLVAVTVFRYYRFSTVELESLRSFHDLFRKQVITRLDSLMYGVIGAYTLFYHRDFWFKYKRQALFLGIVLMVGLKASRITGINQQLSLFNCVFSFSVDSLGTLLLLPFLSDLKSGKGYIYRAFTRISLISYSMYLINFSLVLMQLLRRLDLESIMGPGSLTVAVEYFLFWFLTIVPATLIYKYFELPAMRLRDARWVKRWFREADKEAVKVKIK